MEEKDNFKFQVTEMRFEKDKKATLEEISFQKKISPKNWINIDNKR